MGHWKKSIIIIALATILLFTASWAFYRMINEGAGDILEIFGISNVYAQGGIVIVVVMILLFILGFSGKKLIKKIMKLD